MLNNFCLGFKLFKLHDIVHILIHHALSLYTSNFRKKIVFLDLKYACFSGNTTLRGVLETLQY